MGKNHSRAPNIKQPGQSGPKLIRQPKNATHNGQRISQFKRSQSTSAIELIRHHDSLMFAVALAVRLSILKLMGVDGHSSEALSMWKAFAEEDKKDMECEVIYCVSSESYILYSNRFTDICEALDKIKSCQHIPPSAKDTLEKLASLFGPDDIYPMFASVNPTVHPLPKGYDKRSAANPGDITIFRDEAIKDYLVDYHSDTWKGQLDLSDLNTHAIVVDLYNLESELAEPKLFKYDAREIAKKLMKWVDEAKRTIELDQMRARAAAGTADIYELFILRMRDGEWPVVTMASERPCNADSEVDTSKPDWLAVYIDNYVIT